MWEYKILMIGQGKSWHEIAIELTEAGRDGWDCFAVLQDGHSMNENTSMAYHFKRWVVDEA